MYLNTWMDWSDVDISKYARENSTYSAYYFYWRDELFGRVMRLFEEQTDPIPPREIEIRLMMQGHVAIAPYKGELTAFWGLPNGISKYRDDLPFYSVHCPVYSDNLKIGRDCEMIRNNILMNPLYDLVHHYAMLLAHTEVTYITTAVNARSSDGVPVAKTEKQKLSIKNFFGKRFNGQYDVVEDIGMFDVNFAGAHMSTVQNLEGVWNARKRILADFMSDIGIKSALEKRSNTVSDEANADTPALLINLDDMLNERKEGFERVNRHYGTNWTVKLNKNIDYENMFVKGEQEDVQDNRSV